MNNRPQATSVVRDIPKVDPEIRQFADIVEQDYAKFAASDKPTIEQSRETAETVRRRWVRGGPKMAGISDLKIVAGEMEVRIRLFEAAKGDKRPVLVYLHGGGWTIFSLDTHDRLMREYAARSGLVVIGVDYSLAPEAKFPRQIDEVVAVIRWLSEHGSDIGVNPARMAIGGDSAGANMALATCLRLRDSGFAPLPRALLMNYGAFDAGGAFDAEPRATDHHLVLTHEEMGQFWRNYLNGPEDQQNPLANPILADLESLPPAFLAIAECDILRDENLVMADRLRAAGVEVESVVYPGATHSFLEAVSIARVSDRALADASGWLAKVMAAEG
jgi:acetyl esterase